MRGAITLSTLLCLSAGARAQPPSPKLALEVARVCYLEASFRETDCVAIWHVARKRAAAELGVELASVTPAQVVAMLSQYSAIRARNPRAEEVREYPDADVASMSKTWNAQWQRLRELAMELCQGKHPDPCPTAKHWGGTMDPQRGGMVPARCARGVVTANTFYAVRR